MDEGVDQVVVQNEVSDSEEAPASTSPGSSFSSPTVTRSNVNKRKRPETPDFLDRYLLSKEARESEKEERREQRREQQNDHQVLPSGHPADPNKLWLLYNFLATLIDVYYMHFNSVFLVFFLHSRNIVENVYFINAYLHYRSLELLLLRLTCTAVFFLHIYAILFVFLFTFKK